VPRCRCAIIIIIITIIIITIIIIIIIIIIINTIFGSTQNKRKSGWPESNLTDTVTPRQPII